MLVISATAASTIILLNDDASNIGLKTFDPTLDEFEGVFFEVSTDKDVYKVGEDIKISAILRNVNDIDTTLYCHGYEDGITGKRFTLFNFYSYDDTDSHTEIWNNNSYPTNATPPLVLDYRIYDYNITINASSQYITEHIWNQQSGKRSGNHPSSTEIQQVPPGTYYIVAEIVVNFHHYYGNPIPLKTFGNMKKITIEE